jgi:hypothetical protein
MKQQLLWVILNAVQINQLMPEEKEITENNTRRVGKIEGYGISERCFTLGAERSF